MNRRLSIVLGSALLISAAASFLVYRLARPRPVPGKAPAIQVVVAARDLEIGTLLREGDLKMADWFGPAPRGFTVRKSGALNRGVVSAIYEGEPITENRLAPAGSGGGLAATIPAGMRACAVRVNEVVGVAGFVIPGMRVDVLITGVPPDHADGSGSAVKTLLQNIQVLSAGSNIDKDKEGKPQQVQVVNLLVDPRSAELLSLAGNETRIQLVLRNPMDTEITKPPGTFMSELFGSVGPGPLPSGSALRKAGLPPAPERLVRLDPPAVPAVETIEVLNGGTHTVAKFPGTLESK